MYDSTQLYYLRTRKYFLFGSLVFSLIIPSSSQKWQTFAQYPTRCIEYCGCNCSAYYPDDTNTTCTFWTFSNTSDTTPLIKTQFPSYYKTLDTFIMCPSTEYEWLGFDYAKTVNISGSCHMCPTPGYIDIVPLAQIVTKKLVLEGSGGILRGDCPLLNLTVQKTQLEINNVGFYCTSGTNPIHISGTQFNASFNNINVFNADLAVNIEDGIVGSNINIVNASLPNGTSALNVKQFSGSITAVCLKQALSVRVGSLIGPVPLKLNGCVLASPQTESKTTISQFPGYVVPSISNLSGEFILAIILSIVFMWTIYSKSSSRIQRPKSKKQ